CAPPGELFAAEGSRRTMTTTTTADPLQVLRRVSFFDSLSMDERRGLYVLLQPVEFEAGETIVREGDAAEKWYVLTEGTVLVERADLIGQNVSLAVLGPGESFGESALLT